VKPLSHRASIKKPSPSFLKVTRCLSECRPWKPGSCSSPAILGPGAQHADADYNICNRSGSTLWFGASLLFGIGSSGSCTANNAMNCLNLLSASLPNTALQRLLPLTGSPSWGRNLYSILGYMLRPLRMYNPINCSISSILNGVQIGYIPPITPQFAKITFAFDQDVQSLNTVFLFSSPATLGFDSIAISHLIGRDSIVKL